MSTPQPVQDRFAYTPAQAAVQQPQPVEMHASSVMPRVPDPAEVFAGPGYNAPRPLANPLAKVALLTGVFSVFAGLLVFVSLVLSVVALRVSYSREGAGRREARGALVLSLVLLAGWGAVLGILYSLT